MRAAAGVKAKTLSVRELLSGRLFLADSGADVSVYPATASDKLASEGSCSLRAANGTGIKTYGTSTCLLYTSDAADDLLCVDLGGRRII